jgi:hypothetical protein
MPQSFIDLLDFEEEWTATLIEAMAERQATPELKSLGDRAIAAALLGWNWMYRN